MNCERAREQIPLDVYGDLDAREAGELLRHVEECPACRKERDDLRATRAALDAAVAPEIDVDVVAVRNAAAAAQHRALRRWKRTALAVGALAAGLLAVLLVRPEVEIGGGQFVVRWGDRPAPAPPREVVTRVEHTPAPRDEELEERVRLLGDLVRALREDMETNDRARKEQMEVMIARLEVMRLQAQRRWDETRRDVAALYTAHFGKNEPGDPR